MCVWPGAICADRSLGPWKESHNAQQNLNCLGFLNCISHYVKSGYFRILPLIIPHSEQGVNFGAVAKCVEMQPLLFYSSEIWVKGQFIRDAHMFKGSWSRTDAVHFCLFFLFLLFIFSWKASLSGKFAKTRQMIQYRIICNIYQLCFLGLTFCLISAVMCQSAPCISSQKYEIFFCDEFEGHLTSEPCIWSVFRG